jgi:hypothetical protein
MEADAARRRRKQFRNAKWVGDRLDPPYVFLAPGRGARHHRESNFFANDSEVGKWRSKHMPSALGMLGS